MLDSTNDTFDCICTGNTNGHTPKCIAHNAVAKDAPKVSHRELKGAIESAQAEYRAQKPDRRVATFGSEKPKRPLYPGDVALYHDLCVTYVNSEKRKDEHWLAKFALERYDQIMPLLLAALPDDGRAEAQKYIEKRPF